MKAYIMNNNSRNIKGPFLKLCKYIYMYFLCNKYVYMILNIRCSVGSFCKRKMVLKPVDNNTIILLVSIYYCLASG